MRRLRALVWLSLVCPLPLTACGKGGGIDLPEARAFPPPGAPEATTLVSAGTGERVLRFAPKADTSDKVRVDATVSSIAKAGGQSMTFELGLDLTMASRVEEVEADGRFRVRSVIDDVKTRLGGDLAKMGGESAASMMADMMKGIATAVTLDSRGRMLGMQLEGDNPVMQQMQMGFDRGFQSGFVPLPEEAVGPGAEWDVLGHMDSMGVKARLAARYKLVALEGSRATLEVTMRGAADPQATEMQGAIVELERLAITGSGTMTIDLERPTRGEMDLTLELTAAMEAQGQSADAEMSMRMKAHTP